MEEKALKNYYRKIKKLLKCSRTHKKRIMSIIHESIQDYCNSTEDDVTYTAIYNEFGTPEVIANFYLDQIGPEETRRYRRQSLCVWGALMSLTIIAVILFSIFIIGEKSITIVHSGPF